MEAYSGLPDVRIEGIEPIAVRYKNLVEAAKKKNYDILDHRKHEVINHTPTWITLSAVCLTLRSAINVKDLNN
jgi:hypothetical protein